MAESKSLSKSSLDALRQDGLTGFVRQLGLYLSRRISWRSTEWSKNLDVKILGDKLLRDYGERLKRNEIFRGRHPGKRCFVLGNGPSLRKQDLALLANEITFVTNSFYVHPLVGENWQPDYYFFSDHLYFDGSVPLSEFQELTSRIRSAPIFVPCYAEKFLSQSNALPPERTYYVAAGAERLDRADSIPDFTQPTPGMQTVVQLAMMAAMYMGCTTIYLMGVDHDWLSHGGADLHFYSEEEAEDQPDGHVGPWTYLSLMEAMTTMWQSYIMLQRIAKNSGIKIVNCTAGGFLDVFPRAKYEDVVSRAPDA